MRLQELAYVMSDDGAIHRHIDDAMKNMKHHSLHHAQEEVQALCQLAVDKLNYHLNNISSLHEDPQTFLKLISHFKGNPNKLVLQNALAALGSYTQTDNE